MICWYCHWGWPKIVYEIYERARDDIDKLYDDWEREREGPSAYEDVDAVTAMDYGPAHVVWSDENFDSVNWCLKYCDDPLFSKWRPEVLEIIRRSLRELDAIPLKDRMPCPDNYDGEHPENFPPPPGVEMIRK